MTQLTEQDIDRLALEGCEMIGFKSGSVVAYDVAGYTRCSREPVVPASLPSWNRAVLGISTGRGKALPEQARFAGEPYPVRVAGFRRRDLYGPDEIGSRFRSLGIAFNDGLGNGLYESLLINRKYGLHHVLEAPILGFDLPFLEDDWPAFREHYPQIVQRWIADLQEMEAVYQSPLAGPGEKLVVLWGRHYPLDLFTRAYFTNPQAVSREMQAEFGCATPPLAPQGPQERASLVKFWNYVRDRQSRILVYQAGIIRQALGPGTQVVANPHELPVLDMEDQARAYEYPAVAIRPLLLDDPVFLRHYIAYFTQLYHDLTGKPPMVSVRMNLSAATPRFVPTGDLIRAWYDQAIRHGAGGFYFWTRDYPTSDAPGAYDGPIPGNPIPATLPGERWEASLETLGLLSTHRRFQKPAAEVAILVPYESALLHCQEWRWIYAAFSGCAEASLHTRFLSDRQIERSGIPAEVRLVLAPVLEFVSPGLREKLEAFTARRGALLVTQDQVFNREGRPAGPLSGAQLIDKSYFNIFSSKRLASQHELERAAQALTAEAERLGLDGQSWLFDVTCDHLPPSSTNYLRDPDPVVKFSPWMYEHGSEWIMPYLTPGNA